MAAPNLKDPALVTGEMIGYVATTTLADVLVNGANSNKAFKINAVYCANVSDTLIGRIVFLWRRSGVDTHFARLLPVPVGATQILVAREAYVWLKEGDRFMARADTAGILELTVSYEDVS